MKFKSGAMVVAITLGMLAGTVAAKPSLAPSIVAPEDADKMVVIKDTTKKVNVFENDTVLFKVGDKQFAVKFDGNSYFYDLGTLAPAGLLNHKVRVYVAPNPKEHEQGVP